MIGELWYKNAIIYSLDVGTFLDGNGDGVGNFEGLHNFNEQACETRLHLPESDGRALCNLLTRDDVAPRTDAMFEISLDALAYRWFRIGGLDYAAAPRKSL